MVSVAQTILQGILGLGKRLNSSSAKLAIHWRSETNDIIMVNFIQNRKRSKMNKREFAKLKNGRTL